MRSIAQALFPLALALAACATTPVASTSPLPPALQRVLDEYATAWEAEDAKGLAALFAADRTVVPNACPPVDGLAEVERCYRGSGGPLHLRGVSHSVDGGLAYIIGEYALDDSSKPVGKFVLTLVKIGDRWMIAADMDRSYAPPPTPAPSAPG